MWTWLLPRFFLPMLCVPFMTLQLLVSCIQYSAEVLCGRDEDDGVAPDEDSAELPRHLAVHELLCVLEHRVDVDVERLELPAVAFPVLELDDHALVPGAVQHVQWPLLFHILGGEGPALFKGFWKRLTGTAVSIYTGRQKGKACRSQKGKARSPSSSCWSSCFSS